MQAGAVIRQVGGRPSESEAMPDYRAPPGWRLNPGNPRPDRRHLFDDFFALAESELVIPVQEGGAIAADRNQLVAAGKGLVD